uniref:Uncharacterized protein n=1 Tax=Pithovirus LCPAC202 TaxID=2506592 RepID=A0A481Z6F5_9VIRU|nr:MAG: hypothetical protein LCPAC202_01600 [Pithovirus LCPAC202]
MLLEYTILIDILKKLIQKLSDFSFSKAIIMSLIQPITPEKRGEIFDHMIAKHCDLFKTCDATQPIIIVFSDDKVGSEFKHHYADETGVRNVIETVTRIIYTSFEVALPHIYDQMKPVEQRIEATLKLFHNNWDSKTKNELVFVCTYPAGLDNSEFFSQSLRLLLGGCMEISFYKLKQDDLKLAGEKMKNIKEG